MKFRGEDYDGNEERAKRAPVRFYPLLFPCKDDP